MTYSDILEKHSKNFPRDLVVDLFVCFLDENLTHTPEAIDEFLTVEIHKELSSELASHYKKV